MSRESLHNQKMTTEEDAVLKAFSAIYTGVFLIDLKTDRYSIVKAPDVICRILGGTVSARHAINLAIQKTVCREELVDMLDFVNLATLPRRMAEVSCLNTDYRGEFSGWVHARFLEAARDGQGRVRQVLYVYEIVDEEKRRALEHIQALKDSYRISEQENKEKNESLEQDKQLLTDDLRYQNNFVKILLDQMNCGIMAYTVPGRNLLQINREALRIFGWKDFAEASRKMQSQPEAVRLLNPEDAQKLFELRSREDSVQYQFVVRKDQGEEIQVLAESKSLAGRYDGKIVISTFVDVTHLTSLEADNTELTQAIEAVHAVLNAGSYVVTYNETGENIAGIRFSDTLRRLYGYDPDDPEVPDDWQTWIEGAIPEDRAYAMECFNAAMQDRSGNTTYDIEYRCRRKDGQIRWMRAAAHVLRRENGSPISCYGLIMDIDAQKKAAERIEDALQQARLANEAKTSFLARMSHDIRTPLNGILGLIELNDKHADDLEFLAKNRKKARIAANHLLELINDVLQISKMEDPNVKLAHEPFHLPDDVFTIAEMRAEKSGIAIRRDDDASIETYPYVWGSPLHVRQILINILGNAVKYNKPGGRIRSRACTKPLSEKKILFCVIIEDTGIGMSEEFQRHLFDPFAREHEEAGGKYEGSGLGLSIVKQLVDKMGGTIQVESQVGKGSRFTLELPFEPAQKEDMEERDGEAALADITGRHILLVEDNELNMEIAEMLLQDAGAQVTGAVNGRQAVECFAASAPGTYDAILMDVMMPVMNGYEATEAIRAMDREDAKEIPILAITANAFTEDVERAKNSGMNDHLSKPLNIQKMIALIAKYMRK